MTKWVYSFGAGHNEGGADMKNLLGGKGANLAEMARIGLPVPPGFSISTEVCTAYYDNHHAYPADLKDQVAEALHRIERAVGREVRGQAQAAAGLGALRRARLDAWHDGHGAQSRPQRCHRAGARRRLRRCALRVGQLPPLHPDVRAASCSASITIGSRKSSSTSRWMRACRGHRADRGGLAARGRRLQGDGAQRRPASRSRRTRRTSSGARSAPCSAAG